MFKIGYRTLKTAIGVTLAISIAQMLDLKSFPSAGIITILCIQVTKKKSIHAAFCRFIACIIAMLYSTIFFEGIAFHPAVIGLMLLVFIPTVVKLNVQEGVVTSSVILLHIYSSGHVTPQLLLNETGLLVIGISVALIMNLYMPSKEKEMKHFQESIEEDFRVMMKKMVLYLRTGESRWDGKELMRVIDHLAKGKVLAYRDVENHVKYHDDVFYQYFIMREKQFEVLENMLTLVAKIPYPNPYSGMIAALIEEISEHVHPYNTSFIYLNKLESIKEEMQKMELPVTREEFNVQSALFDLIKELEKYLMLKNVYKGFSRKKRGMKTETAS
ncbi:MAG: aromatic acid exporter family protein [Bacillus sp. (in: firmicutes)]